MDEVLDVLDVAADLGFGDAFAWLLRIVGLLLVLAAVGIWLFVDVSWLVPAVLAAVGLVALLAPTVLLLVAEFA